MSDPLADFLHWIVVQAALVVVLIVATVFLVSVQEVAVVFAAFLIASAINAIIFQPWIAVAR